MAILIRGEILHIEVPKTGTTWLRRALEVLQVPHTFPEPIRDCCPRHAAPNDYHWNGPRSVTVRHPKTWVESMWKSHRGRDCSMFIPEREYPHRAMHPMGTSFEGWLCELLDDHPEFINQYYERMIAPCEHKICFEKYEKQLAKLFGWDEGQLNQIALQNVSRPWPCDWTFELSQKFHDQTLIAQQIWEGTV